MNPDPGEFVLPTHCAACGAFLMGGATTHTADCPFGRLIEEFKRKMTDSPDAKTPPGVSTLTDE